MGAASPLLWLAAALGVAGVGVLRLAWALPRRSAAWNAAGWSLLLAATVGSAAAEGAWGVAVAALLAMAAALAMLAVAGARSPAGRAAGSNRRVGMLPEGNEPRRIGRRLGTFALVIFGGFAASLALALATRALGGALGWHAANANALALFAVPLGWAVLSTVLLMQASRRSQVVTLVLCGLTAVPALLTGGL